MRINIPEDFGSVPEPVRNDNNGMLSPRSILEIFNGIDREINAELGVSLAEVNSGGKEHRVHKGKMKRAFLHFLRNDEKFSHQMDDIMWNGVKIPRLICVCMPETPGCLSEKKKVVNHMLVDFASSMKMNKANQSDGCPFYQPNSQC